MYVQRELRMNKHFGNRIYGCDETSVWLDTGGNSVEKRGAKEPTGPIPSGAELMRKERQENEFNELTELFEEVDLMQDEENGILSDNSLELMAVSI
uniref:Uncharacterized protein n=1 Tax=Meloidogyne incognita TaxID=6306 RepID=A0A914NI20_MELIC